MSPEIYIRAGEKLKSYGHSDRGDALIKYSKICNGLYNMTSMKNSPTHYMSDLVYSGVYGAPILKIGYPKIVEKNNVEYFIETWRNGNSYSCPLSVYCSFSFPLYEISSHEDENKDTQNEHPLMYNHDIYVQDRYGRITGREKRVNYTPNMFNIEIKLCDHVQLSDKCENITELYEKTKNIGIYFYISSGIFSDRKSANIFKFKLQELIINNNDFINEIMRILDIVGGPIEDLEYILELFKNIRTNVIYSTDLIPNDKSNIKLTI